MSGIASIYGYSGPLDPRLSGLNINQAEIPWWCVGILNWLALYRNIQEGYGKTGTVFRQVLEKALDGSTPYRAFNKKTKAQRSISGPSALYAIYEDFIEAQKSET